MAASQRPERIDPDFFDPEVELKQLESEELSQGLVLDISDIRKELESLEEKEKHSDELKQVLTPAEVQRFNFLTQLLRLKTLNQLKILNQYYEYLQKTLQDPNTPVAYKHARKAIGCLRFIKLNQAYLSYAYDHRMSDSSLYSRANGGIHGDGQWGMLGGTRQFKAIVRDFYKTGIDLREEYKTAKTFLNALNDQSAAIEWLITRAFKEKGEDQKRALELMTNKFDYNKTTGCLDVRIAQVVRYVVDLMSTHVPDLNNELQSILPKLEGDESKNLDIIMDYLKQKKLLGTKVSYRDSVRVNEYITIKFVLTPKTLVDFMVKIHSYDYSSKTCLLELQDYKETREAERKEQKSEYHAWGRIFPAPSATDKISADDKLTAYLNGNNPQITLTKEEFKALHDKRLGRIVKKYQALKILPDDNVLKSLVVDAPKKAAEEKKEGDGGRFLPPSK